MEFSVFIVSAIYWVVILVLFAWLSRRVSDLRKRISEIEKGRE